MTPWTVAHKAPLPMEFSRQEYWSGLPFPSPRDLPDPGIKLGFPALQADALPSEPPGKPTLCDPMDYSPSGPVYLIHGTLQARILEQVAISFSRGSSDPGIESVAPASPALQMDSLPLSHRETPNMYHRTYLQTLKEI